MMSFLIIFLSSKSLLLFRISIYYIISNCKILLFPLYYNELSFIYYNEINLVGGDVSLFILICSSWFYLSKGIFSGTGIWLKYEEFGELNGN
jgi:hypothetical protein